MSVPDQKEYSLEELQKIQLGIKKVTPDENWNLPAGSPTAILYAARSIWKNEPEKLAWYEKSYQEHLDRHNEEKPGTWWEGTWYEWDFDYGYPWTDPEKTYNWRPHATA